MKVHFIAIGGSAMHNLAIALFKKGYVISGSDDEIFEPSKSRLAKYGLLPDKEGWDEEIYIQDWMQSYWECMQKPTILNC
jgi:UDP-N-acetylmuramate: L-alanyl-gamma-D-glutamyl-meso-diaminopimelate ligase